MATPVNKLLKKGKQVFFQVNLLIHKETQPKVYIQLLKWLLSFGRYIVIIVELVTISAFVFRYKLDSELLDLQDKIKPQIAYVESLQTNETLIKQTQFQLSHIKQTRQSAPDFPKILTAIASLTPQSVKLSSIQMDRTKNFPQTSISINGQTTSNLELSSFVKSLQSDPNFSGIVLSNISFEDQATFTITGQVTKKGAKTS